jgi:hypothetical protein
MATLSVLTFESSSLLPDWSDIFKCLRMLIEYYQKDKMMITGCRSYGDISSTGRKNVCSMNDNSDISNHGSGDSGNSTPCSFTEYTNPNLSEVENLNRKIDSLQWRIQWFNRSVLRWTEVRDIADKLDRSIPLTHEEWSKWLSAMQVMNYARAGLQFDYIRRTYGYSAAVDSKINRAMSSIRRASIRIDMHNQRIQTILAEASQNQDNSADNSSSSDSDNN